MRRQAPENAVTAYNISVLNVEHQPCLLLSKYGKTDLRRNTMDYRSFKHSNVAGGHSHVYKC